MYTQNIRVHLFILIFWQSEWTLDFSLITTVYAWTTVRPLSGPRWQSPEGKQAQQWPKTSLGQALWAQSPSKQRSAWLVVLTTQVPEADRPQPLPLSSCGTWVDSPTPSRNISHLLKRYSGSWVIASPTSHTGGSSVGWTWGWILPFSLKNGAEDSNRSSL